MPYIKQEKREEILDSIYANLPFEIKCAGDLNYIISYLCNEYLKINEVSYKNLNELIGALECAKLELYRRVAVPYEDVKIKENGDVYDIKLP